MMIYPEIIKNLCQKIMLSEVGFLKRDYFEVRFLKDQLKIEHFYDLVLKKSYDRLIQALLNYNSNYGIIIKKDIVKESKNGMYWKLCAIDNYGNFVNQIVFWGFYIALVEKNESYKVLNITYMIPFLDEVFYCADGYGMFLNDRKITIENSSKCIVKVGVKDVNSCKLGAEIFHLMYVAANRVNFALLAKTEFLIAASDLVAKEVKACMQVHEKNISIGNVSAHNFMMKTLIF